MAIVITTVASALLALGIGIGSLRVRGLYLAVVTFVFALTAQQYFYFLPFFSGDSPDGANVPFAPGHLWFLDFPGQRTYYYVVLAVLGAGPARAEPVPRQRRGPHDQGGPRQRDRGRRVQRAHGAGEAAGVHLAGALAGLGGALLAGAFANIAFTENFFLVNDSLNLVAMVVIGGMGSVSGAVIGAIFVIGIPAIAPNNALVGLLSSSLGLAGGPAVLPPWPQPDHLRGARRHPVVGRSPDGRSKDPSGRPARPSCAGRPAEERAPSSGPVLAVSELSVHFGGIAAVDKATLHVRERRDRRSHRGQRGGQVDADERRRWLRRLHGFGDTPRRGRVGQVSRLPGLARARADVPGRHTVSRADGQRDTARRARGEGPSRHVVDRARPARGPASSTGPRRPRWASSSISSA